MMKEKEIEKRRRKTFKICCSNGNNLHLGKPHKDRKLLYFTKCVQFRTTVTAGRKSLLINILKAAQRVAAQISLLL
jgi:hypothetical protein